MTARTRDDLDALVSEGRISARAAAAIRRRENARRRRDAEREREASARRARVDEEARMAPTWARFVLAHSPAYGDLVVHSGYPLREAVADVKRQTGCDLDCGHEPLTAQQAEDFLAFAAAVEPPT